MRILITGASGSGTSTLGNALAAKLKAPYFDVDDYFWLSTDPPYTQKRDRKLRLALLLKALRNTPAVVGGSIVDWGEELENAFTLVVFLTLPTAIRIARLKVRETAKLGRLDLEFLEWAAQYEEGGLEMRSRALHERWLSERSCPVLRIEGDVSVDERVARIMETQRT